MVSPEVCEHANTVPEDEAACYGYCEDCGKEGIENGYLGHYPCDDGAHDNPDGPSTQ